MAFIDITGRKFNKITVISLNRLNGRQGAFWNCVCDCGNKRIIRGASLKNGTSKSCGCVNTEQRVERFTTHGLSRIAENQIWRSMKFRCGNTKHKKTIRNYVDRGIVVCERWKNSFEDFYADMGKRPRKGYSIERIDNNGNYSCGKCEECLRNGWKMNCEWDTIPVQNRNHRRNRWYEYQGERLVRTDWARVFGIKACTLESKLRRGKDFKTMAQYFLHEHGV